MSTSLPARDQALTKSRKVWHVVGLMNRGGAEVMVMELLRHSEQATQTEFLVHHRHCDVVGKADFDAEILALGAKLLPINTPVQSGLRAYFRTFNALVCREGRPDVIHIHLNARSGLVVLAARRHRIGRIIVHSHAALTFRGSLAYRILAPIELMIAKMIFAAFATDFWGCSRDAINSLFARWPSRGQPRVIIKNAIDVNTYTSVSADAVAAVRDELLGGRPGLLIGTVGRIVRHKNAMFLLEVLDVLLKRGVMATLAIIGREEDAAYCAELRARAAALGLSDSVRQIGARSDIPAVMGALDVFASPALREGFGLVALEAQAAGTHAVVSTGFPADIDMGLGIVKFLDKFDAEGWADAVLDSAQQVRPSPESVAQSIASRGFSAEENSARIERAWRDPEFLPGVRV